MDRRRPRRRYKIIITAEKQNAVTPNRGRGGRSGNNRARYIFVMGISVDIESLWSANRLKGPGCTERRGLGAYIVTLLLETTRARAKRNYGDGRNALRERA